jgi:hypothetical protein
MHLMIVVEFARIIPATLESELSTWKETFTALNLVSSGLQTNTFSRPFSRFSEQSSWPNEKRGIMKISTRNILLLA